MEKLNVILFLLLLTANPILIAQSEESVTFFSSDKKNERYEAGAPVMSFYIAPVYLPELEFCFSGGFLLSYKTKRNNPYLSHSYSSAQINANLQGDINSVVALRNYWYDNLIFSDIKLLYNNFDNQYWGVGYTNSGEFGSEDRSSAYHETRLDFTPSLQIRLPYNFYFGISFNYGSTEATELSDLMKEDLNIINFGSDVVRTGPGISLHYKTRLGNKSDNSININLEAIAFDSRLGSDHTYQLLKVDYRQYLPIIRKGSLLAWRIKSENTIGEAPWTDMPTFGGSEVLRGVFTGEYRNSNIFLSTAEYRHIFLKRSSTELSRHSLVFWVGGATAFPDLRNITQAIVSMGLGYRYAINPENKIRVDIGFGTENVGIYVGFDEVF